jgi:hypothetical protein
VAGFCISLAQPEPIPCREWLARNRTGLRGFGRSNRPVGVAAYSLQNAVDDVVGILDAFDIDAADIVGHDWGATLWEPFMHSQYRRQPMRLNSCESRQALSARSLVHATRTCVHSTRKLTVNEARPKDDRAIVGGTGGTLLLDQFTNRANPAV